MIRDSNMTKVIGSTVPKRKLFSNIQTMFYWIILCYPIWFSSFQNKRVLIFNFFYHHKDHVMNLMTFRAKMFSDWFWSELDEGFCWCFVFPPSVLCFSRCKSNILALRPTGRSCSSTLIAGNRIDTILCVAVNRCVDVPGLVPVQGCVGGGVLWQGAAHASAVHASFETFLFPQTFSTGWGREFCSYTYVP